MASRPQPIYDLESVPKTSLANTQGVPYLSFRKGLSPNYLRVWAEILLGYLALALCFLGPLRLSDLHPVGALPLALAASVMVGFWVAYIQLFIHEAAHYNIAPDRAWNDRLSNAFIGILAGLDTASYRQTHWDHHRFLGRPNDTESTYFSALSTNFIFRTLTGAEARRVLKDRKGKQGPGSLPMRLMGMALHAGILGLLALTHHWVFAAAWAFGVLSFFPFFAALRQLLEHRSLKASAAKDYRRKPHGKIVHLFKPGPLNSLLGAAGFRWHLLHHWDPQIPYTRLGEVEGFLMGTRLGPRLAASRTTYLKTFRSLYKA